MGKLEPFDNKRTQWSGLWYHNDSHCFTSSTFSLADIRKFKGNIRLVVRKNRYYNDGENNRPNYVFMLIDSKAERYSAFPVVDDNDYDSEEETQASWLKFWDEDGTEILGYLCSRCGYQVVSTNSFCPRCFSTMSVR